MKKSKTSIWTMNANGNMVYHASKDTIKLRYKAQELFDRSVIGYLIILICGFVDFVAFKSLFGLILYDSVFLQCGMIIGLLFGFDFVPIYLGKVIRKRSQGYKTSLAVICGLVLAFAVAIGANAYLRIASMDQALPDLSSTTYSILGNSTSESTVNPLAPAYAVFMIILPLITSIGSLCVSYVISNPLAADMKRCERIRLNLEDDKNQTLSILAEYESDADKFNRMIRDEYQRYNAAVKLVYEQAAVYEDYFRQRLKEHLADPAATNELSRVHDDKFLIKRMQDPTQSVPMVHSNEESEHIVNDHKMVA